MVTTAGGRGETGDHRRDADADADGDARKKNA